jgi:hypothetical protein
MGTIITSTTMMYGTTSIKFVTLYLLFAFSLRTGVMLRSFSNNNCVHETWFLMWREQQTLRIKTLVTVTNAQF